MTALKRFYWYILSACHYYLKTASLRYNVPAMRQQQRAEQLRRWRCRWNQRPHTSTAGAMTCNCRTNNTSLTLLSNQEVVKIGLKGRTARDARRLHSALGVCSIRASPAAVAFCSLSSSPTTTTRKACKTIRHVW